LFAKKEGEMKGYADLADLPEDERIRVIGEYAMAGNQVGVPVDEEGSDGYAKADRYVKKLLARFPLLEFVRKGKGPVANVVTFVVRRKGN
jgi:hypothetical protein